MGSNSTRETNIIAKFGFDAGSVARAIADGKRITDIIAQIAEAADISKAEASKAVRQLIAERREEAADQIKVIKEASKAATEAIEKRTKDEQTAREVRMGYMREEAAYLAKVSKESLSTAAEVSEARIGYMREEAAYLAKASLESLKTAETASEARIEYMREEAAFLAKQSKEQLTRTTETARAEVETAEAEYSTRLEQIRAYNQAVVALRRTQTETDLAADRVETEAAATEYNQRLAQIKAYNQAVTRLRRQEREEAAMLAGQGGRNARSFMGGAAGMAGGGPLGGILMGAGMGMDPWSIAGMATVGLTQKMYDLGVEARKENFEIEKLGIYMGGAASQSDILNGRVRQLAVAMGTDVVGAAKAMQEAISMATRPADAESLVKMANNLALIKGTEIGTEAHILSGIRNAFGMKSGEIGGVADKLARMRTTAHLDITEGQMGGLDVLAEESGASFDDMITAMSAMSVKDVKADRAVAALRQLMTKAMYPTEKAYKAQEEAGFHFDKQSVAAYGFIGALQRLDEALKRSGVSIREALGVESNRGTLVAIEAMLDKKTVAQIQAELAASAGSAREGGEALLGTEEMQAKSRGARWGNVGARSGSGFAAAGAGISKGLLWAAEHMGGGFGIFGETQASANDRVARQEAEDAKTLERAVAAMAAEKAAAKAGGGLGLSREEQAAADESMRVREIEDARRTLLALEKQVKSTTQAWQALGRTNVNSLTQGIDALSNKSEQWGTYIIRLQDRLASTQEKISDKIESRGSDYSTRTKTGNMFLNYQRAMASRGTAWDAMHGGDLARADKETNRYSTFMGNLRGEDLLSIAQKGFNSVELENAIDTQMNDEGVVGSLERSRRRTALRGQARDFEKDVDRRYTAYKKMPGNRPDRDFSKWFVDSAERGQLEEQKILGEGAVTKAKDLQGEIAAESSKFTTELEKQVKLSERLMDIQQQMVELENIKDVAERTRRYGTLVEERKKIHAEQTKSPVKALAEEGKNMAGTSTFLLEARKHDVIPVETKQDIHVDMKVTLQPGTTEAQAKELAQKLGMHMQTELERGRIVLTNSNDQAVAK